MFLAFDGISSLPCHTAWISKLSEGITSSLPILFISHWGFGEKESLKGFTHDKNKYCNMFLSTQKHPD